MTARTQALSFTGALWRPEFSYPHMAAAFFVAAKYEEQKPPRRFEVADVACVDGARGGELLLELEGALLRSVDFRLSAPTAYIETPPRCLRRRAHAAPTRVWRSRRWASR